MKRINKWLASLLAVSMLIGMLILPAGAANDFTVSMTSGTLTGANGTFTSELTLANNPGLLDLTVNVYYKNAIVTCSSSDVAADQTGWTMALPNNDSTQIPADKAAAGWKMASFGYFVMGTPFTANGKIGSITFSVADGAENGTAELEVEVKKATGVGETDVGSTAVTQNGTLTIAGIPATIDEVTVTPNIEVDGTGDTQNLAARATSVKGTDITGNVTWSVEPPAGGKGVTVSAAGIVSVSPVAVAGDYKIKAAAKAGESQGSGEATLTVTRAASVVNRVMIADTPSATIAKPVSGDPKQVTYVATAYDQYGDAMTTGATINWSNNNALANVTVTGNTVTVPTNAGTGSFKLTATCDEKSTFITVNVVDIEFTGADAAITAAGTYGQKWSEIVKIDASKLTAKVGDTTVTGTYTVVDADTVPAAGEQTYSVTFTSADGNYQNIPVVTNATVNVAKKAVTVVAEDKTRPYGNANPELTWTVNTADLVGTDTKDVLTVNLTTTATETTAVGEAAITGTGTADNYAITVTPGKLTITPVKVTAIAGMETALNLSKAEVLAANDLKALGLAEKVTLTLSDNVAAAEVTASYDKDLAAIKTAANAVTDAQDGKVEVTLTNACFPAYAVAGDTLTMPKTTITITNKYPIPAADITMADATVTYGETYEDPAVTVADKPEYAEVTKTYAYTDKDGNAVTGKPVNAGEYTVTVTVENASYKGSQTAKLTIAPKALADSMVTLPTDTTYTYNKTAHTPVATVKDGDTTLVLDTDYTVAYADNVNAGTATVTVTGKGNYGGTTSATFEIAKASLAELKPVVKGTAEVGKILSASVKDVANEELKWVVTVGDEELEMVEGLLSVQLLPSASNQTFTVKAVAVENGNYTGETLASDAVTVAKFTVAGDVYVTETNVDGGTEGKIEAGDVLTAEPDLNVDMGEDPEPWYTVQWFNNGEAIEGANELTYTVAEGDGVITVTVTPNENFNGSVTSAPVEVGKTVLSGTVSVSWTDGDEESPVVGSVLTATVDVAPATEDDYTVAWYRDGVAIPGATGTTYTVVKADQGKVIVVKVTAKGDNYTGELTMGGLVKAAAPDAPVVRATAGNGQVTVSWAAAGENGAPVVSYTVAITDPAEAVTEVEVDATTTSHVFTGLTNGTEYTFTVTANSEVGNTTSAEAKASPKGSSGGSSGGGSSSSNTKTVTLSDGTKVTTTTLSGGVTKESIVRPNGTKADMTYNKDGSGSGTVTMKDGSKATVTATKDGEVTAKVTIPAKVDSSNVTIPDKNVKPGTVAVIVKDDGTEQIVRMSTVDEVGVMVKLTDSATIKLVNNAKSFVDVPGHWAEANVDFVSAHELFNGTDETHFTPNGTMTRGMMATVLFRLDGENKGDVTASFADVADGTWYTDAVAWANAQGIVTGYSDTAFGPDDNVTREQLAVMIYRYAKALELVKDGKTELAFVDADSVNDWAAEAVSWLTANGILIGKPGNVLDPQGNATRAEVSAVLERFVEFAVK